MIVGPRAALGLLPRPIALTLALATALTLAPATALAAASAAAAAAQAPPGAGTAARVLATGGSWVPAWSWRSGSRGLPNGCAPYSGRTSAGMRWSPSLVRIVGGRLRLATAGGRAGDDLAGSGIGCTGRAERYARVKVRARIPRGAGLVTRIALWPSRAGRGSDWSGLTVPSADLGPAYATNGCGDEAYGAAVPGKLSGAFHDYLITWSPKGFSVAMDGRTLYKDSESFDRPRWLGISLSATGASAVRGQLLVEKVIAYSWTGRVADRTTGSTTGSADAGATASAARSHGSEDAMTELQDASPTALSAIEGGTTGAPGASGPGTSDRSASGTAMVLTADSGSATAGVLDPIHSSGAVLIGGALVALGVLLGVFRAARGARRRPQTPR